MGICLCLTAVNNPCYSHINDYKNDYVAADDGGNAEMRHHNSVYDNKKELYAEDTEQCLVLVQASCKKFVMDMALVWIENRSVVV